MNMKDQQFITKRKLTVRSIQFKLFKNIMINVVNLEKP